MRWLLAMSKRMKFYAMTMTRRSRNLTRPGYLITNIKRINNHNNLGSTRQQSGYEEQFKRAMTDLMKADGAAHKWVQGVPFQVWSRHAFSGNSKTDTLLNNLCEGFNSTIVEAREKPIISMVEDIRIYLMLRFQKNRTLIETVEGVLCPVIQKRLNKEITYSGKWIPLWSGDLKFEVKGFFNTITIDLEKECSCRKWLLIGIPCSHVVACIHKNKQNVEDYTSDYYKVETYKRLCAPLIGPTNGPNLWEATEHPSCHHQ